MATSRPRPRFGISQQADPIVKGATVKPNAEGFKVYWGINSSYRGVVTGETPERWVDLVGPVRLFAPYYAEDSLWWSVSWHDGAGTHVCEVWSCEDHIEVVS